jgi:LmbE family N-acetylglucosaminyl deacetylase
VSAGRDDPSMKFHEARPHQPHDLGTILSVWAHPDDETYLAAGVMASARDNGQRVVCVSATAGELGTDDPDTWPPERLRSTRRWEATAALAVLGVTEHRVWEYPDGGLDPHDETAIRRIGALIRVVRPHTILTFGSDGITYHPDHIAVHRWVTAAWEHGGRRQRLLYAAPSMDFLAKYRDQFEEWDMYMSDQRPVGVPADQLAIDLRLTGAALDRKLAALRAMATQTSGIVTQLGLTEYTDQIAEESFIDARRVAAAPAALAIA